MANLPYLASPGSIVSCLERIKAAATPERFTTDFVNTILLIKGGTGAAIIPFLKKIGFVSTDGTPTDLYKRFRNQSTGGTAIAEAIKMGYKPLLESNEYFYKLNDTELKDLIVQVTGLDKDNATVKYTLSTIKNLKAFASFDDVDEPMANIGSAEFGQKKENLIPIPSHHGKVGFNLSYTINLNLPATTDQAVFNAIFKSMKEHLLNNE